MLFKENQLEIIDCGLFVPYSCSWRMNFYEIMFLVFKGYTYHIHQRVNLHNFSRDDAPFTENKGTGPAGEGVLLKITVEVCSMLPERLTLPQTKIRDLPCLTSAFRRRVIERNITYSRALFHGGKAYSVSLQKGVNSHTLYNLSRAI